MHDAEADVFAVQAFEGGAVTDHETLTDAGVEDVPGGQAGLLDFQEEKVVTGGIDLSVGSIVGFVGIFGGLILKAGMPLIASRRFHGPPRLHHRPPGQAFALPAHPRHLAQNLRA